MIKRYQEFEKAIEEGRIDDAEKWLLELRKNWDERTDGQRLEYDDSAISAIERIVIRAYREAAVKENDPVKKLQLMRSAKQLIVSSIHSRNVLSRILKFEEGLGVKFAEV